MTPSSTNGGATISPEAVRAAELAFYKAMIAQDHAAMRELLAEDLDYIHSTGVIEGKEAYLDGIVNGLYEYSDIQSVEPDIRVYDKGAVIMSRTTMYVSKRGEPKNAVPLVSTLVWALEDGKLRLRRRHATRLPAVS